MVAWYANKSWGFPVRVGSQRFRNLSEFLVLVTLSNKLGEAPTNPLTPIRAIARIELILPKEEERILHALCWELQESGRAIGAYTEVLDTGIPDAIFSEFGNWENKMTSAYRLAEVFGAPQDRVLNTSDVSELLAPLEG